MYFYLKNPKKNISHCQSNTLWRDMVIERAEESLSNTFRFTEKYEMERCTIPVTFSDDIDWDSIPYGDNEWCFAFNRHTFLLNNAKAAAITGDKKYRENWIRLFEDFFHRSKLSGKTRNLSWRSLESGIRIENYIRSIEIFSGIGLPVDDATLHDIEIFFDTHIEYLKECHTAFHRLSNWGVLQDHGLFLASLYRNNKEAMEIALERLDEEMRLQTLPDGMHWEQSTMYQAEVLHAALDTIIVGERNGVQIPEALKENTHLLASGLARSLRPDGKSYLFGDSDEIDMRDIIASAALLFNDGELSYFAEGGLDEEFYMSHELDSRLPREKKPADLSFVMKESGNAFLRLSENRAIRFHAGPIGSGHGHLDQLHFDVYENGNVIITDTGRYTYTDSKERYELKGGKGHNTILPQQIDQAVMDDSWAVSSFRSPAFGDFTADGDFKLVSATDFSHRDRGTIITRSILALGDEFVIIADDVSTTEKNEVTSFIHLDSQTAISEKDGFISAVKGKSAIRISFIGEGTTDIGEYHLSKHYNEMESSPLIIRKSNVENRRLLVTIIALGDEEFSYERIPVIKVLSGTSLPEEISFGVSLKGKDNEYIAALISDEYPSGGFLLGCGKAEAYGRIFVMKNDEPAKVIRY